MPTQEFNSKKSQSIFTVTGDRNRAYLTVTGEAYGKAKVRKEINRIRQGGATWDEAVWTAKMLASTF